MDDLSRVKVIKRAKHKSQALDQLADFKRDVAKSNPLAVKKLRSYQGGEFIGIAFQ